MNNITKYRRLIINALLVIGIIGILVLMKAEESKCGEEPTQVKSATESINAFEMVSLKFL
jgi:hypothetical protein